LYSAITIPPLKKRGSEKEVQHHRHVHPPTAGLEPDKIETLAADMQDPGISRSLAQIGGQFSAGFNYQLTEA
jgi:hypothetical protein